MRWIEDELRWWNPWHERESVRRSPPSRACAGARGSGPAPARAPHSAARGRGRDGRRDEPHGGRAAAAARLGLRYVATDVSPPALRRGRTMLGDDGVASVQCDAVSWPIRDGVADLVLVLGVLHHLSDWRAALERACRVVRPGGFLVLHEVVAKPRVLARLRSRGFNDDWVSPHEGDVPGPALREVLERHGEIVRWSRRGVAAAVRARPLPHPSRRPLPPPRGVGDPHSGVQRARPAVRARAGARLPEPRLPRGDGRLAPPARLSGRDPLSGPSRPARPSAPAPRPAPRRSRSGTSPRAHGPPSRGRGCRARRRTRPPPA